MAGRAWRSPEETQQAEVDAAADEDIDRELDRPRVLPGISRDPYWHYAPGQRTEPDR